jgi:hypothetical protein
LYLSVARVDEFDSLSGKMDSAFFTCCLDHCRVAQRILEIDNYSRGV